MNNAKGEGAALTWTNSTGSDVSAGDVVVVGQKLAIAAVDIANGSNGTVEFEGRYTVPKTSGAVIKQGEMVMWDVSAGSFDDNAATPATGDVTGCAAAAEDAGNGVTSFDIVLDNQIGTVN